MFEYVIAINTFSSLIPLYIKTLYKDDPLFRDTKVIYSIFDTDFKGQLNADLMEKLLFERKAKLIVSNIGKDAFDQLKHDKILIKETDINSIFEQKCDIISPCALGGSINSETKKKLNCKHSGRRQRDFQTTPGTVLGGRLNKHRKIKFFNTRPDVIETFKIIP